MEDKKFQNFLKNLAHHEEEKSKDFLTDPRQVILVNAGIRLNWLGDFFANPTIKWEEKELPLEVILFTGTSLDWNRILLDRCEKKVEKFLELMASDEALRRKFRSEASFGEEIILVRKGEKEGTYKVLDGMKRFVGHVLEGKETISVYLPVNEDDCLPICEAHVVYDLLRAFRRHARDEKGKEQLYQALSFLLRTYANVRQLLSVRFGPEREQDEELQEVITKVLKEN